MTAVIMNVPGYVCSKCKHKLKTALKYNSIGKNWIVTNVIIDGITKFQNNESIYCL